MALLLLLLLRSCLDVDAEVLLPCFGPGRLGPGPSHQQARAFAAAAAAADPWA
ncbi:unnamed protein product [Ectocarpus sp. 12 AP-2014]